MMYIAVKYIAINSFIGLQLCVYLGNDIDSFLKYVWIQVYDTMHPSEQLLMN